MKDVGLIGFGEFGRFMVEHLKAHCNIFVYDKRNLYDAADDYGITVGDLSEVASKEVVILAVPVQFLEELLLEIKEYVQPSALIVDVSSVKKKPLELMEKYLPDSVEIVGTHPLFGPQSAKNGIEGLKIVLCPLRTNSEDKIKNFLSKKLKLEVLVKTPEEHDQQMAYVQGLTHFIGKAVNEMDIQGGDVNTLAFEKLLEIKNMLKDDSWDLFLTMERENPFAAEVRRGFLEQLEMIEMGI